MVIRADYYSTFNAKEWERIAELSTPEVLRDIGWRVAERAKDLSPVKTGHNRSSIGVVTATGKIEARGAPQGGRSFTDAAGRIRHGETAVLTTSGYGGYLEVGARLARHTKKGKMTGRGAQHITSGGTKGSYYMQRASAKVLNEIGFTEAALQSEFYVRAKRAEIRRARRERGR